MIAARLHKPDGGICVMLVLEPGNIEKIKQGQPIHKWLNEFMPDLANPVELLLCYTPDAVWVAEQIGKDKSAVRLAEIIEESRKRPEVLVRDKTAEEMKRAF